VPAAPAAASKPAKPARSSYKAVAAGDPKAKPIAAKKPGKAAAAPKPVTNVAPTADKKPAAKPASKPSAKAAGKTKTDTKDKTTRKLPEAPAAKPQRVKDKLVRDSFTMPGADFALIHQLKERALGFKRATKKSELLRAGLQALASLSDTQLQAVLGKLTAIKAGRPKKAD
jgi:hypothetical protein